jgi:hypothetical protein
LTVEQFRPVESNYTLSNISPDQFLLFTDTKLLTPDLEQVIRTSMQTRNDMVSVDQQIRERDSEAQKITADQNRLRKNMNALKGSTEERALLQRYTRQLDSQEDRLVTSSEGVGKPSYQTRPTQIGSR